MVINFFDASENNPKIEGNLVELFEMDFVTSWAVKNISMQHKFLVNCMTLENSKMFSQRSACIPNVFNVNDAKLFFSTTSFTTFRTSEKISRCMNTFYSLLGLEIQFPAFDDLLYQVEFSRKRSERKWYFCICEIFPPLWK